MNVFGHLAVAITQHRLFNLSKLGQQTAIFIGVSSLFPDIVDKSIGYIFQLMPNGRHYAHNVFSLVGSTLVVFLLWGKTASYAWGIGYLGHLLADTSRTIPWLFPIRRYSFSKGQGLRFVPSQMIRELIWLVVAVIFHRFMP